MCHGRAQGDVKIHKERLQQTEQTMKEQFELESLGLLLSNKKNVLREFLQGQNVSVNFLTGLLASSNPMTSMGTAAHSTI